MVSDSETYDLSPTKQVYRSLQSDVTPITAIKELIDNALDNWKRVKDRSDPLEININYNQSNDELVISDNSGGISEDKVPLLFAIGRSTKEQIDTPIGAYGMGGKKAIVKLGNTAEIKSRHVDAELGYGYSVDQNWLDQEDVWDVEKQEFQDLNSGETIIKIRDLKDNFGDYEEELLRELRETYELFLDEDLEIKLNGQKIEPPEPIPWSFTPFDDLHPRRYENIKIEREDLEHPVYLHVTVGVLTEGSSENAGTDIFCQSRKVLAAQREEKGGFGDGDGRIGNWGTHQLRLKVKVEFEIQGNADKLPWDTQKNDINVYNPIFYEALNEWISRLVRPYWEAGYEDVPSPFLSPYGGDDEYAANNGQIISHDYEGRVNVTNKPNTNFSDISGLDDVISKHLEYRIKCPQIIDEENRPAYEKRLDDRAENNDGINPDRIIEISEYPEELEEEEFYEKIDEVLDLAQQHAEAGERYPELDKWWFPLYLEELSHFYSGEIEDLTLLDHSEIFDDESRDGEGGEDSEQEEDEDEGSEEDENGEDEDESTDTTDEDEEGESKEETDSGEGDSEEQGETVLSELGIDDAQDLAELLNESVLQRNEELKENIRLLNKEKEQLKKAKAEAEERLQEREQRRQGRVDKMKRKAEEFKQKLDQEELEGHYQDFLKKNPWFFGAGRYLDLDDEFDPWPGDRNDFLIQGTDGYHDIVELKRPDHSLFWEDKPERITSELRNALCQMARYLHNYETGQLFVESRIEQKIMKPGGIIVIGRQEEDTRENIKRLNSVLDSNIEILTYDDLLERAQAAIEHYENAADQKVEVT